MMREKGSEHREGTGLLKVMSTEGPVRATFCKWGFSAEAGQFSLEFLPETTSTLSGPLPLLLAKVIVTLESTLPLHIITWSLLMASESSSKSPSLRPHEPWWEFSTSLNWTKIWKAAIVVFLLSTASLACEGWGSGEVIWDVWDHESLQEDWKESCEGVRTA